MRLPVARPRKILCALALSLLAAAIVGASPSAASEESGWRLERAGVSQAGRELIVTVRTNGAVPLGRLQARPDTRRAGGRYLCVAFGRAGRDGERRLCLGGKRAHRRVGLVVVSADEKPTSTDSVRAKVRRARPNKLVIALEPGDAGLPPRRYRWRVIAGHSCAVRSRCAESLPAQGTNAFRLRPVRAVGCTGGSPGLVTNGPRDRKLVALTFDDGPSDYTDGFLAVLREKDARATFFEVGQVMPGREEAMREILAQGSEIGDHTMDHVEFPGYEQIAGAAARIKAYTHFQPCLFRPPGGAVDAGVIATAGSLGMRTVNWDVDPRDWSTPGTGAIYADVVGHVRPGSIVVMHDGGGPRGETLAALPRIIDTLRGRGYRFATVTDLLGGRILYRPYG